MVGDAQRNASTQAIGQERCEVCVDRQASRTLLARPYPARCAFAHRHPCPDGGIGRRTSFRCWRSQGRGGSSPLLGTKTPAGVASKTLKKPQKSAIFGWILMPRVSRCFRPCPHNQGHGAGHMPPHAPFWRKVMPPNVTDSLANPSLFARCYRLQARR